MQLKGKTAVVHGGGGAIGGEVARAFAAAGAAVFLTGRREQPLADAARHIEAATGVRVHTASIDARDEGAVEAHLDAVERQSGGIDISFNAVGNDHFIGTALTELTVDQFATPLAALLTAHFVTARAAARRMIPRGRGVILTITATPGRLPMPLATGFGVACAAVEGFSRTLAVELGSYGIRTVCLRSAGSPDAPGVAAAFAAQAATLGTSAEQVRAETEAALPLRHMPRLAEIGAAAVFAASDQASAMTAAALNLTAGAVPD